MVLKRFVISDDSPVSPQVGDVVAEVYSASDYVVEREVPDAPVYYPSMVGTASVENQYGVVIPNQHGVWVKTANMLYFRVFEAKYGQIAAVPEKRVSDFVPDPTFEEFTLEIAKERDEAVALTKKETRRANRAEEALRALVQDLQVLRNTPDVRAPIPGMRTAAGATMKAWVANTMRPVGR